MYKFSQQVINKFSQCMGSIDSRFMVHNSHLESTDRFSELDPNLRQLKKLKYVYHASLLKRLPTDIPGIYTISGGRQVGKTTLLKQWMEQLIKSGVRAQNILFLTGEIIDDHHTLIRILSQYFSDRDKGINFIIIDEITYIKEWDKGIKFLADSGIFEESIVILTGSDLLMIQEARMRFPGRRGKASQVDFHLYPLSFRELVLLQHKDIDPVENISLLFDLFNNYLIHGGYLTAINDFAENKTVSKATVMTYSDWVRGDTIKHGKSEHNLNEFLQATIKTYGTQITWNSLAQHVTIEHPKTIQEYANLLESMDVLFIQHAIIEDKLTKAPKKAKKLFFTDPFIYTAINNWLNLKQTEKFLIEPLLAETAVISNIRRYYPTYYIKAQGEVDVAYIKDNKFWPIEIKWTNQLWTSDLKQILKYPNGLILGKTRQLSSKIHDIAVMPLPLFLHNLDR